MNNKETLIGLSLGLTFLIIVDALAAITPAIIGTIFMMQI